MRTPNRKASRLLLVGGFVAAIGFFAVIAATTPDPKPNQAVQRDLDRIEMKQEGLAFHKEQVKEAKASGDKTAHIQACTDLKKAKADLKRDKAYLKADRNALIQTRENELGATFTAKRESKRDLCEAKRQVRKDLRQGNSASLVENAELVAKHQRSVDRHEARLENQQASFNGELAAIDDRLEDIDNAKFENGRNENGRKMKEQDQAKKDSAQYDWSTTASTDKTYYPANEGSAVMEK